MFKTKNTIACYTYSDKVVACSTYNAVTFDNWQHFMSFSFYTEFFIFACDELRIELYNDMGEIVRIYE
jgi:hypothetical protein